MLAHLERCAVAEGRTLLDTETFYPGDAPADGAGHDNADFLTHRGYVFGLGDVHRRLELPADPRCSTGWPARPRRTMRRTRSARWRGRVPDELVESFATINASLMTEAPTGEVEREPEVADVAVLREEEALREQQGRVPYVAVAVDRDGTVVAFTTVMTTVHEPGRGYQWGTVVDRAHRGHRLGHRGQGGQPARAAAARPARARAVHLQRGGQRAHGRRSTRPLGLRPVERLGEFQKRI